MPVPYVTWKYFTRIFSLFRSPSNSKSGSFLFKMITLGERRLIYCCPGLQIGATDLTVNILPGRMIEVIEEVGDARIVDVAADDDELLLVVHLTRQWSLVARAAPPCTLRRTLVCFPQFLQSREGSLQTPQSQLEMNYNGYMTQA